MSFFLVVAYLSMFVLGLADNIRGPLFPEIISSFQLSGVSSSFFYASTSFAAFVASYFSYSFLRRRSLMFLLNLSLFLMALALFIIGFAQVFPLLLVGAVFLGFSIGGLGVSQNLMVSENISLHIRAKALAGLHSIYGMASLLAPLMAAQTTLIFSTWRAAFFVSSAICFALFLVFAFYRSKNSGEQHLSSAKITESGTTTVAPFWGKVTVSGLFAFYVVAEILVSTRLALYMRENFAMNLEQSSLYVTYFFVFLFLGRLIFAFARIPGAIKLQMNLSLFVSLVCLLLGLKFHPFFLVIAGFTMAPYYPLSVAYISQNTGHNERHYLTLAMSIQSLSVVGMHLAAGYLTDSGGVKQAFSIGVGALIISLICLNFHPKKL